MKMPQDIIAQLDNSGHWILYNVFTQDTLAVCSNTMMALSLLQQGCDISDIDAKFTGVLFKIYKMGVFSNYDGLLADPSRRIRQYQDWPKENSCSFKEATLLLKKNNILIDDEEKYKSTLKPKMSLLDMDNVGNFHQQLGQKLLLEKRVDPGEWWVNQKFNPNKDGLNDTLYKSIQENFLKSFFAEKFNSKHKILDVGCGIGYYSHLMSQTGADVLGIDPNPKYIETAKSNFKENVTFKVSEIGTNINALKWIESESFDFAFMSDALLFYFVSPDPKQQSSIDILLSEIRRILKPNGRFLSLEPHGVFWLRPWLGEEERPFTVITEYRDKMFNVAPNSFELLKSYLKEHFIIKDVRELYSNTDFDKPNKRAINFSNKFPLWHFFELQPQSLMI